MLDNFLCLFPFEKGPIILMNHTHFYFNCYCDCIWVSGWFCYAGWVGSWRVTICGWSLWFQLNCYIVPHWCSFSHTHTNKQERIIEFQKPRTFVNEAHILLTAQYLYRSPKQKEKKEEKEQLHCDSLLLDLLQNAAVVQDKHMIGRISASGK